MPTTYTDIDTVVIGAGQAGLAVSRCLGERGVPHVVLERGRVGERWRSERWDSLRLLTPTWMSRLPGGPAPTTDPDGFLTAAEFAAYLEGYAAEGRAPVREGCAVRSVQRIAGRMLVATDDSGWFADNVVLATGWCERPAVPGLAHGLGPQVAHVVPATYRNPAALPRGGVLVVGASATGVQIAHELALAGRDVVLAVGAHSRVPRRYRGRDIYRWLAATGSLDRTIDELPDPVAARAEPSLQLVGRPDHADLDLAVLAAAGITLAGRLVALDRYRAGFAHDLPRSLAAADTRMRRVLAGIDALADRDRRGEHPVTPPPPPVRVDPGATLDSLHLRRRGIGTVLWATGYRRANQWLHLPVLDASGEIRQRQGVTPLPGLYVLGQRFQHFRSSNFIHGAGRDAAFVADHILERARRPATA